MKKLDLGCGNKKLDGAIGLDCNPRSDADLIHDLTKFPYPIKSDEFDYIHADNVLEHLPDVIATMEEIHRISKDGATIKIIVPYFRSRWAFIDPTHLHYFTLESFSYFDSTHIHSKLYRYSDVRFKLDKVVFNEGIKRSWRINLLVKFANRYQSFYENNLSSIIPLDTLTFYLITEK